MQRNKKYKQLNDRTGEIAHSAVQLQPQREVIEFVCVVHPETRFVEVVHFINKELGVGLSFFDLAAQVSSTHLNGKMPMTMNMMNKRRVVKQNQRQSKCCAQRA